MNGVNHLHGSTINLTKEQEQTDTLSVLGGIHDVIDEVMENEPVMLVPNIDDHIFDNDEEVDNDIGKDNEAMRKLLQRPCLMDIW